MGIDWPAEYGGRGASPVEVAVFNSEYARSRAPQLVNRVGINLAGPTLLAHGTPGQLARWLRPITTAEEIWCQLFSEPGAGSDLSGLSTRAVASGDGGWLISGQKVWTSYAQFARWGLCLARSDPDSSSARGLTLFALDMTAPGVEIRPLVQMTGDAEFNEVFLDEVHVPDDQRIGPVHEGWAVASTTLAHERGTNFPFKEEVVHEGYLADLFAEAHETRHVGRSRRVRRARECLRVVGGAPHPQLADPVEPGEGRGAGPRVELGEAHVVEHDPAPVGRGALGARRGGADVGVLAAPVVVERGGEHRRRDI